MELSWSLCLLCALQCAAAAWNGDCVTKPVGFGRRTTGGQGGSTVVPTTIAQLQSYLASSRTLIVDLRQTFDFTNSERTNTTMGCVFNSCGSGEQLELPAVPMSCAGHTNASVTYYVAGTTPLQVASRKSIISSNGNGVIKGKGLVIVNANNIIIRDITIRDINPNVVWGGDAITLDGATNVWIHRCTIKNIGRMQLVSTAMPNTGITVSSCLFDGTSQYSAFCDGKHYWMWLFWGTPDQITLLNNRVLNSAGRLPHAGGSSGSKNFIHMVGNEIDTNPHNAIEPNPGSYILAEGNTFINVAQPVAPGSSGGFLALIDTASGAKQCARFLGQNCILNKFQNTTTPNNRLDLTVLDQFRTLDRTALTGARGAACES